jgi:group I intron endonuclease
MGSIYRIKNTITNKYYIGCTIQNDIQKRWSSHRQLAKKDKGCTALKEAFKKYGIDNFKFEILIICFNEDCFKYEKEYIKKYNSLVPNGYNISEGGNGGALFKGKHHSEETKLLLRNKSKEYHNNPENKESHSKKIKEAMEKSEKWKKALAEGRVSQNRKGKKYKMSDSDKEKISKRLKEYFNKGNNINKEKISRIMTEKFGKKVIQYDINNIYINSYPSISEAVRQTGVSRTSIQYCISGRLKTGGGFIWKKCENST